MEHDEIHQDKDIKTDDGPEPSMEENLKVIEEIRINMKSTVADNIKAALQIHHGGDDGFVPAEVVEKLQNALKEAGVDYNFYSYPGAVHGFTRPSAGSDKESGIAYDKSADVKSWDRMKEFLDAKLN